MDKHADKRSSPRERLLQTADTLFYEQGFHQVGIEQLVKVAGVSRGSMYYAFDDKNALISAYLAARQENFSRVVAERAAACETDTARVLSVFDVLTELFEQPDFHGGVFANAAAGAAPDSPEREAVRVFRRWLRDTFSELVAPLGVAEPALLVERLILIYDGANSTALLDESAPGSIARETASLLIDQALAGGR